jgi:hypothetical protein
VSAVDTVRSRDGASSERNDTATWEYFLYRIMTTVDLFHAEASSSFRSDQAGYLPHEGVRRGDTWCAKASSSCVNGHLVGILDPGGVLARWLLRRRAPRPRREDRLRWCREALCVHGPGDRLCPFTKICES